MHRSSKREAVNGLKVDTTNAPRFDLKKILGRGRAVGCGFGCGCVGVCSVYFDLMKFGFALIVFVAVCGPAVAQSAYKNVGVDQFDKLRQQTNTVVLDVRTPKEFAAGHIPGAVNIDWNGAEFQKKAVALDRSKTFLVHCAVGGRSAKASDKLASLQFTNVYNLEGGMKAWEKAGKAVER
jgi:phage shock protein E